MTRRMTSSIVLTLSLLLSLVSFPLTAQGQQRLKPVFDTGVVPLGPNQILRLYATKDTGLSLTINFGTAVYMPSGCNNDGVCKHTLASQSRSGPVMLNPGEAVSMDITLTNSNYAVRGTVFSNDPNVRVTAMVIDMTNGNTICLINTASGSVY
jgi:hypothetical protein